MEIFPEITSERLILDQPLEKDRADLIFYLNETSEFSENTLSMPFPYTNDSADFWFKMSSEGFENKNAYIFAIRLKETEKIIGGIGLHLTPQHQKAEAGYWIAKDFWNKGYATEALKILLKFGFESLHLNKIYATYFPHNPGSGKIMEKCGMKFEATLKQEYVKNGNFMDVKRYFLLKEDYFQE